MSTGIKRCVYLTHEAELLVAVLKEPGESMSAFLQRLVQEAAAARNLEVAPAYVRRVQCP